MVKITIDDKEYDTEELSDEVKAEVNMLAIVERRLVDTQVEIAILQTAKNAYAKRVGELIPEETKE
ncbi:DUF6447 family protein [Alphaproteobacteria bacterium]|nr:DUF6447 family protein [Alphaproteobacteria bacterium]